MEQISSKRNPLVFVFLLIIVIFAVGFFSYSFLLPRYIEKKILPSLGDQFFTSLTGQVFTIGINEASFGDLTIGDSRNIAASIGSIHADYSIPSILDKKIKQIRINGLTLNLEIAAGRIIIPGLDLEKIAATKTKDEVSPASSSINLPLQLDNFQVKNGLLNILYEQQPILIPFSLQITRIEETDKDTQPAYQLNLQIFPQGQEIEISGSVDLAKNKGIFALSVDSLNLNMFAFLFGEMQENLTFGKASIQSNIEINLMPFKLLATKINGELESLNLKTFPVTFGPPAGTDKTTSPIRLQIMGKGKQYDVSVHGSIVEPILATIALNGSFNEGDEAANGLGTFLIKITDSPAIFNTAQSPVVITGNPELHGDFSVTTTPTGSWQAKIESSASKKTVGISSNQISLTTQIPAFNLYGKGSAETAQMQVSAAIPEVHVTGSDATEIILPNADLQASFNQEKKSGQESLSSGEVTISLPGAKIKRDSLTGKGDIKLSVKMGPQPLHDIKSLQINGEFIVSNASADEEASSVHINSIEGRIPWQWLSEDRETTGKINVSGIKWKNHEIGSFKAGVRLKNSAYSLDGMFTHTLVNNLVTNISGQAGGDSELHANLDLQMDPAPFRSLHLGKFDPSLKNAFLDGELGLEGSLKVDAKGLKGSMKLILQKGRFDFPEKKQAIDNINISLLMPSLPDLRSAPAQKILFEKASVGDLTFEHGNVTWQIESEKSIFIEQGVVRWAGGRVFTNAIRLSTERNEFVVPIFCDRLILSDILRQFSITNAVGEGTVSGRIPLQVSNGKIRFEDGFLYSSPGQGGSIKIAAFDMLSAGIPQNSPQFGQIDFAAEALKDFNYNWVKLLFNSEGEDLVMQMQMDGKPSHSLPFNYDRQTGFLQRIEIGSQGINQPIRLDVNFRLPLDRFLGYSGKIQDIMDKIK